MHLGRVEGNKMTQDEKRCQWHPACYAALNLEFRDNKRELEFQQEIPINVLPLRIDALIIKKRRNSVLKNEIGSLFRTYNLIEYKSPEDELNFNTVLKGVACAYLYKISEKKTNEILLEEITLSFIRERRPRKLFNKLIQDKFSVVEKYKGIYYIHRDGYIPMQVIVSGELEHENHVWLNSLTKSLNWKRAETLVRFTNELKKSEEKKYADSVWELVTRQNVELIKNLMEDEKMCKAMTELFKPEIDAAFDNGFNNGFNNGVDDKGMHIFKNMIRRGFSKADAQSIAEISDELVERALAELNS